MGAHRCHQSEDLPGRDGRLGARISDTGELVLDGAFAHGLARDGQPRGGAVGEEHAQLEQGGQGQGAPREPVDHDQRDSGDGKQDREVPGLFGPAPRGTQRQMCERRHPHGRNHG